MTLLYFQRTALSPAGLLYYKLLPLSIKRAIFEPLGRKVEGEHQIVESLVKALCIEA